MMLEEVKVFRAGADDDALVLMGISYKLFNKFIKLLKNNYYYGVMRTFFS